MKRISLLLTALLMLVSSMVAQIKLVVYKSDGTEIELLASDVDSIGFKGITVDTDDDDDDNNDGPIHNEDDLVLPKVSAPGEGYTTIVLYIPESECEEAEPYILGVLDGSDKWSSEPERAMEALGKGWWQVTVETLTPENATNFKFRMDDGEDGWMYQPKNSYELLEDADDYLQIKAEELNNLVAIANCDNKVLYIKSGKWWLTPCRAPIPAGHAKFIFTPTGDVPEGYDLIFTGNFGADNNEWGASDRVMTKQADGTYVWEGYYPENFNFKVMIKNCGDLGITDGSGTILSVLWMDGDNKVVEAETGSIIRFEGCFTGLCPEDGWENEDTEVVISTPSGYHNSYGYVDLGLPSGTLWATMNVGATSPEDYGDYFAWGETTPKSTYDWSTYKWCNGSYDTQTKYCTDSDYGTVDNKTTLDLSDDAAYVNWGGDWRMPTIKEQKELRNTNYTTRTWTTLNGVKGYKVTSKINGNSIFLPAAGHRRNSDLNDAGSFGYYWSSSLSTGNPDYAYGLHFYSGSVSSSHSSRYQGLSVRPVLRVE